MCATSISQWRRVLPRCFIDVLNVLHGSRSSRVTELVPLDLEQGLYLVVITNKQSNILEDLETLRLLSKLVPEYTETLDEDDVVLQAFELVNAFDEVISLGHKENISVMQVKQNCDMESHEEKLHKMIILVRQLLRVAGYINWLFSIKLVDRE
eukprot:365668-Chlamydomonas_euryale.AAC.10